MSEPRSYRETLHRWATQHIPEDATVTDVQIEYGLGGAYSEWTIEDPHLSVVILYRAPDGAERSKLHDDDDAAQLLVGMGKLLADLFALEES